MAGKQLSVGVEYENESPVLTIFQFNDVYEIEEKSTEPVGGICRFATAIERYRHQNPLVIFGGDCLSPSIMSSATLGEHMIHVLNKLGVHYACVGNHDFDFGITQLELMMAKSNFKWMLGNIVENDEPILKGALLYTVTEWNGLKIGLFSVVESDWIKTVGCFNDNVTAVDQVIKAKEYMSYLNEQGAEIIIALTHSRKASDLELVGKVSGIDLLLGGHDHDYYVEVVNHTPVVTSGCDFRNASFIRVFRNKNATEIGRKFVFDIERINVDSSYEKNVEMVEFEKKLLAEFAPKFDQVIGECSVGLECSSSYIRRNECEIGNLLADSMRSYYNCDIAIVHSGTIRSDAYYPSGPLTMKIISTIFPFYDSTVVIILQGKYVIEALENAVSQYPKLEGRFAQVSGCRYTFESSKPPGSRIVCVEVITDSLVQDLSRSVNDVNLLALSGQSFAPIDPERYYTVATKSYIADGNDGYDAFLKKKKTIVDEHEGVPSSILLKNHFMLLNALVNQKKLSFEVPLDTLRKAISSEIKRKKKRSVIVSPKIENRIVRIDSEI